MELVQTMKLRLYPDKRQIEAFCLMREQYRKACQFISGYVFKGGFFKLSANQLNERLYKLIRQKFNLKSQLAQSTVRTVVSKYKTLNTQLSKKPCRYKDNNGKWHRIKRDVFWAEKPVQFNKPQVDLVYNRDYNFVEDNTLLSINTLGKRAKVPFGTKGFSHYLNDEWTLGTAKLVNNHGCWFLHIAVTKEVDDLKRDDFQQVVGIDRGLRQLLTVYDDAGKTVFVNGQDILKKREKFNRVRAELQAKGTKSAKRRLKKLAQRENGWMTDVNHCLSKALIEQYGEQTLFVLEDLEGVSFETENLPKAFKNTKRSWAFYQFEQFLTYKARNAGSDVLKVDAAYTSQTCPKCGTIDKAHRDKKRHHYHCQVCGYQTNDDRAAAMNIHGLSQQYFEGVEKPSLRNQLNK